MEGKWLKLSDHKIEVVELPVRKWTRDYKSFLEEAIMKGDWLEDMAEFHQDNTVHFVLTLKKSVSELEKEDGGLTKKLKLVSSLSSNNYVLFDKNSKIKKYADEKQILEEFYGLRLEMYNKRK